MQRVMQRTVPGMLRPTIALLTALLAPDALGAQQPADTVELAPVVITPTRRPTGAERVTQATTTISGAELRTRGLDFVADALRDVPGAAVVQVGSLGGVTSLFLRGGNSNYVKVLVDGVPMNQAGGAFDFADLSTANVDRIEIVRGPASVVYGSDAVSGVVQVFTRSGLGRPRASLTTGAGTFGTTSVDATAAGGSHRLAASAGFRRLDTDGTYPFNSHYRNATASARVDAAPDSLTDASLTARYFDRGYRFPTDGTGAATDSNQVTNGDNVAIGLDAGRRLSRAVEARVALALRTGTDAFDDKPDGPADTTGFAFASTRHASTGRRSIDARLIATPRPGIALTGGLAVEREHERQTSLTASNFGFGASAEADSFDRSRTTRAAYIQSAVDLARRVSLDGGLRVDDNSAFGTFVTARAGAAVRVADFKLRASTGNAFKAPTFSETFASSPFEVGDPDLRPERTTSWELGVEQRLFQRRGSLSATWFDQRFRDLIQYAPAAPGEPTYANLAAATAHGIELVAMIRTAVVGVSAQYTWLRTRVTDAGASESPVFLAGEALVRRPAHSARLGLELTPLSRVRAFANLLVTGRRDDVDFRSFPAERVTLPAVATVDLAADVDLITGHGSRPDVALRLRVENVFNKAWDTIVGFPGRRRALLAGVRAGL
jgi:vitamin B12 transporter